MPKSKLDHARDEFIVAQHSVLLRIESNTGQMLSRLKVPRVKSLDGQILPAAVARESQTESLSSVCKMRQKLCGLEVSRVRCLDTQVRVGCCSE